MTSGLGALNATANVSNKSGSVSASSGGAKVEAKPNGNDIPILEYSKNVGAGQVKLGSDGKVGIGLNTSTKYYNSSVGVSVNGKSSIIPVIPKATTGEFSIKTNPSTNNGVSSNIGIKIESNNDKQFKAYAVGSLAVATAATALIPGAQAAAPVLGRLTLKALHAK